MRHRFKMPAIGLLLVCLAVVSVVPVDGATVKRRNIGHLVSMGTDIIAGQVTGVSDGFDANGVPYTEVTLRVDEAPKGAASGTYTFRQFGLIEPHDMGNGRVNLNVTPDGWPTYSRGEDVVLFLYKKASLTGLRTTVGLFQGKFMVEDGQITNVISNEGLFRGVNVDRRMLNEKEAAMLNTTKGGVPVETFLSFVNKSVQEQWFTELGE